MDLIVHLLDCCVMNNMLHDLNNFCMTCQGLVEGKMCVE